MLQSNKQDTLNQIFTRKIVVILRGYPTDLLLPTVDALFSAGIRLFEIPFPAEGKEEAQTQILHQIQTLSERYGGEALLGAGTVLEPRQAETAAQAGARFLLSPDCNPDVIRRTAALGLVSIPGVMTPTEAQLAHRSGADIIKVFPAVTLGPVYFRQMAGPLPHLRLMAVGGVSPANAMDFLRAGATSVGIGSALISRQQLADRDFAGISADARALIQTISE